MNTRGIFDTIHTIAVIGLSDKPDRYSYQVAQYLQGHGFRIIPVNPNITEVFGEPAYDSIASIPTSIHIDAVDIFRNPSFVFEHIREAVDRGDVRMIWLQEGVSHEHGENYAREHGLTVISNMCMMKTHKSVLLVEDV